MPQMAAKDLKSMRRSELQKLAKQHGVKANKKTEDIKVELQKIFEQDAENEKSQLKESPRGRHNSDKVMTPRSADSTMDLMSVQPPWNDSDDILSLDSTPQRNEESTFFSPSVEPQSRPSKRKQTRSPCKNGTPTATATGKPDGRTFSIERPKTKAATTKALRKRPTIATASGAKTPTAATAVPAKLNRKTFSTERLKTKARSVARNDDAGAAKAVKKRSTNATAVGSPKQKRRRSGHASNDDEPVDEDMKNEIMKEIREKIAESGKKIPKNATGDGTFATRIPRFNVHGVTVGTSKPITPGNKDWNKIHSRRFGQLESIDDYETRKKERAEKLLGSNKKNAKQISKLAQPLRKGRPRIVKPVTAKGRPLPTFVSPAPGRRAAARTPRSIMKTQQRTPKAASTSVFKPTVTSTSKMNLNFARKTSKIATPKKVTIVSDQSDKRQTYVKTPATGIRNKSVLRTPAGEKRKSTAGTPKTPSTSLNNTTPGGTKKPAFDLKKSLQKPLTWATHKGPLRPFNDTAKKPSFHDRIKDIKKPNAQGRDKRKQKMAAEKKHAKDKRMMIRRGIE